MDTGKTDDIKRTDLLDNTEDNETDTFAKGLPDWDLVPPQVTVRRRKSE